MSVGTLKVERKFAVRNVTELIVDASQQADRGRETRLNDVDGSVRGVKSAGRIDRLLRNKRSFGELCNHKGECAIPCDKQVCSFSTLSGQESSQTTQMDEGEIEIEGEKRVRMKCMPVLPTYKEKHEKESAHVANCSQCKTEDSRNHLESESSVPQVAMDRGFLAHSTDVDLVANTMLIQKLHNVAEARQVSHEAPESHAVNCVLEKLDANGLGRVLLKGSVESDAQTLVDPAWVGRGERILAENEFEVFASVKWCG